MRSTGTSQYHRHGRDVQSNRVAGHRGNSSDAPRSLENSLYLARQCVLRSNWHILANAGRPRLRLNSRQPKQPDPTRRWSCDCGSRVGCTSVRPTTGATEWVHTLPSRWSGPTYRASPTAAAIVRVAKLRHREFPGAVEEHLPEYVLDD
jgi:hypothetical protein